MKRGLIYRQICCFFFLCYSVFAGLNPLQTLVVVNRNSPDSIRVGRYYQRARNIPDSHYLRLDCPTNYTITQAVWSNSVEQPVLNYIDSTFPSNQIRCLVFMRDIPYRIYATNDPAMNRNGMSGAMFYGWRESPAYCSLPDDTTSDYFASERPIDHFALTNGRGLITFALTCWNNENEWRSIDRTIEADATSPTGSVYLLRTTDTARNIQWYRFDSCQTLAESMALRPQIVQYDSNQLTNVSNILGYTVGTVAINDFSTLSFDHGSWADNLTSYAGSLYDPPSQMPAIHWISNGVAGSYGTVMEPCNYQEKFTDPRLYAWLSMGFSMGESGFMAIEAPYQGIFVGDPLCSPYATRLDGNIAGFTSNAVVSGITNVTIQISGAHPHPVSRLTGYMDGVYMTQFWASAPQSGQVLSLTVHDQEVDFVITTQTSAYEVVSGFASALRTALGVEYTVTEQGKRVEILFESSDETMQTNAVLSEITSGSCALTIPHGRFSMSPSFAMKKVTLSGTAASGDIVTLRITDLSGLTSTASVICVLGETGDQLITRLASAVNAVSAWNSSDGVFARYAQTTASGVSGELYLTARTNGVAGQNLRARLRIETQLGSSLSNTGFLSSFLDNSEDVYSRVQTMISCGVTQLEQTISLDTTALPDGYHELTLVAHEGGQAENSTCFTLPFYVSNTTNTCQIISPEDFHEMLYGDIFDIQAACGDVSVTQTRVSVDATLLFQTNQSALASSIDSHILGPGLWNLVAQSQSASNTYVSPPVRLRIFTDSDADGMPDEWEFAHFNSVTGAVATADADSDGASNLSEYLADTDPQVTTNVLYAITTRENNHHLLQFPTSIQRLYSILENTTLSSNWPSGASERTRGTGTAMIYELITTNSTAYYRIRADIP